MQKSPKIGAASRFTLSALMGPLDANLHGNVHGGVIMNMVDEAGALVAMRHARAPVVTVAIDSMTFMHPIRVGDLVLCNAELTFAGRTSMEVREQVIGEHPLEGITTVTNIAYLVCVALDQSGQPTPVPPLIFETPAEEARANEARQRQEYRKQPRIYDNPLEQS